MKKMFLLFSHKLTSAEKQCAEELYGVEEFLYLPHDLQKIWSNISPDIKNILHYLEPLKKYLSNYAKKGDVVLIQGDFGATYHMVKFSKEKDLIPIYATTKRKAKEYIREDKIVKESIFEFVRFREYE